MRPVLLLIEDYNEQGLLEGILKRIGFDVESIRNEASLADRMVDLRPEVVVATGDGKKISGQRVNKKVKTTKGISAKLMLLYPREQLERGIVQGGGLADAMIETPVNPKTFLVTLCEMAGLDPEPWVAKYAKLSVSKEFENKPPGIQIISGSKKTSPILARSDSKIDLQADRKRVQSYDKLLRELPPSKQNEIPRKSVQEQVQWFRRDENTPEIKSIDEERKSFVEKLFKKK